MAQWWCDGHTPPNGLWVCGIAGVTHLLLPEALGPIVLPEQLPPLARTVAVLMRQHPPAELSSPEPCIGVLWMPQLLSRYESVNP
jgi:hypothetical protein